MRRDRADSASLDGKFSMDLMVIGSRYGVTNSLRADRYSKLYWLDIDVVLQSIFYRQRRGPARIRGYRQPSSVEYCGLEGIGAVANRLNVGQEQTDIDRFSVHIAPYVVEDEEHHRSIVLRPSANLVWNNSNEHSPRSDIYIPNKLSRHLVELYVTKRIDRVQLSIQIAIIGDHRGNLDALPDGFPLLGDAGHLHFRRTQCELLSVYTSLANN